MIPNKLLKKYKKEIIIGILIAFFISFAKLIATALEPIQSNITMRDNSMNVLFLVINLLILSFLVWLVDKA